MSLSGNRQHTIDDSLSTLFENPFPEILEPNERELHERSGRIKDRTRGATFGVSQTMMHGLQIRKFAFSAQSPKTTI